MRYDVIVVGAGPGGSTAARECADRGMSVLMLDRDEFPRDKPCGGGVTPRAADLLPFEISPVVERVIHGVYISVRQSRGVTRRSSQDLVYLTQRRDFDNLLAERAVEAGVCFRQRTVVRQIERRNSDFIVRSESETFKGEILVAADGANGQTAKMAGVNVVLLKGVALEGNITPNGRFPKKWSDTLGIDVGTAAGGYGWIFPKGDHLNFGVGGWEYVAPNLKHMLRHLVEFYGFNPDDIWGQRGYHLPIRQSYSPLAADKSLVIGDAAGLIDPLTGEGIYSAIWTGRASAKHIAAHLNGETADLKGYEREVTRELLPELKVSRQLHDLFTLAPSLFMAIEKRTTRLWELTKRLTRGEQTYASVMARHTNFAFVVDLVSDLVRVTPFLQRISGLRDPAPPQRFFVRKARN